MRNGPFEHNEINNYLWNRQGKRHYWGIIGKDYGFLESTSLKKADNPSDNLSDLKNYHIQLRRNPYQQKSSLRLSEDNRIKTLDYNNNQQIYQNSQANQYKSENPQAYVSKLKTEPIQYSYERPNLNQDLKEIKKKHLSLLSKNIQIQNGTPKAEQSKRFSTIGYQESQREEQISNRHRRMNSEGNNNEDLNKYRQRIVKIVRRDRKNNPTFCNSLAYPLHCYRYVE